MNNATLAILLAYRALVIGGCTFLVGWHGWSPWWFVLAILACEVNITEKDDAA